MLNEKKVKNLKRIDWTPSWLTHLTSVKHEFTINFISHCEEKIIRADISKQNFITGLTFSPTQSTNKTAPEAAFFISTPCRAPEKENGIPFLYPFFLFQRRLRQDVRQNTKKNGLDKFYFIGKTPTIKDPAAAGRKARTKVPDQTPLSLSLLDEHFPGPITRTIWMEGSNQPLVLMARPPENDDDDERNIKD